MLGKNKIKTMLRENNKTLSLFEEFYPKKQYLACFAFSFPIHRSIIASFDQQRMHHPLSVASHVLLIFLAISSLKSSYLLWCYP